MKILGAIEVNSLEYTHPSLANKNNKYKCPDCNELLILKKGKIKIPHFSHKSNSKCTYYDHPNESQIHKEAKLKLCNHLKKKLPLKIKWNCKTGNCENNSFKNIKYKENDEVIIEYKSKCNKYIADIAVINNDNVRYIFEIKYTHETITDVRPEPWFEIDAETIINLDKIENLTCLRICGRRICDRCFELNKKKGCTKKEIRNLKFDEIGNICIFCENDFACEENNKGIYDRCLNCDVNFSLDKKNYKNSQHILNNPEKYLSTIEYGTVLNCPFKDKDIVKKYGAKWDKESKKWYVPRGESLGRFYKWLPIDFC